MSETDHFGVIFVADRKDERSGKGVFRLYVRNWTHCDYPGIPTKHAYLMPQVTTLKALGVQLDRLMTDIALLRLVIAQENEEFK